MIFARTTVPKLTPRQRAAWLKIRQENAALASPLLSLGVLEHVARSRDQIEVLTAEADGEIVALLPVHVSANGVASPFAGPLADVQGIIAGAGQSLDIRAMLRTTGVSALHFNAQLAGQAALSDHQWKCESSPFIDISDSYEAYCQRQRDAGCSELKETLRKGRKLDRELGAVSLELRSGDESVTRQVLGWKNQQLQQAGKFNALQVDWVDSLMAATATLEAPDCQGMVSALRVGDKLAAGAIMVVSEGVAHGWVMSFNPEFRRYSPGSLLLLRLLEAAAEAGIHRVDMGRGPEPYKRRFQTGTYELAEGSVDRSSLRRLVRRQMVSFKDWLGDSTMRRWAHAWVNRRRYAQSRS